MAESELGSDHRSSGRGTGLSIQGRAPGALVGVDSGVRAVEGRLRRGRQGLAGRLVEVTEDDPARRKVRAASAGGSGARCCGRSSGTDGDEVRLVRM